MSTYKTKIKKAIEADGWYVKSLIVVAGNGFPDLLALKDSKAVFIEVKEATDTLKPLQKYVIARLCSMGFCAFAIQKNKGVIFPKVSHGSETLNEVLEIIEKL